MTFLRSPFSHDETQSLYSANILLRYPTVADFEPWVALRRSSRAFLEPWEPLWQDDEFTRLNFRSRIKHYQKLIKSDAGYPFFIFAREDNALLGAITVSNVRRGVAQMATIGYWIGEPFSRRGYMTEAINAVTRHAFSALELHRIEAACIPTNVASVAVLKRCGFAHEGYAEHYLKIAGQWRDHLLFSKRAA
jgi:ribosomal-protein-alanine N-acetyltransferase